MLVDAGTPHARYIFTGYNMLLVDPQNKQRFIAPCTAGDDGLPAWPYFVAAQHVDAAVASELAAIEAIGVVQGLASRYSYEAYLEAPAEALPAGVVDSKDTLRKAWQEVCSRIVPAAGAGVEGGACEGAAEEGVQ